MLPNSLSVVIPAGGHDYTGLHGAEACIASITGEFVVRGGPAGVDASCVTSIRRPPFPVAPVETRVVALTDAQLSAFAGQYAGEGAPSLDITLERGRLMGRVQGQAEPFALAPVSPTRLRLLGALGSYLDADMQGAKAQKLRLEQAGTTVLTWTRVEKR